MILEACRMNLLWVIHLFLKYTFDLKSFGAQYAIKGQAEYLTLKCYGNMAVFQFLHQRRRGWNCTLGHSVLVCVLYLFLSMKYSMYKTYELAVCHYCHFVAIASFPFFLFFFYIIFSLLLYWCKCVYLTTLVIVLCKCT